MPAIELSNVPKDLERYPSYLMNNFRRVADALLTVVSKVDDSDIEITSSSRGLILTSPNGTRYRVTVDNAGTLIVTAL